MKRSGEIAGHAHTRLHGLAAEHGLDGASVGRLARVLEFVARDPRAPTSVTASAEAVDVHIADSLSGLPVIDELRPSSIADVGSGAGFPGLPIAAARAELAVDLVESAGRKCRFLEDVVAGAGLDRARVVHARVEEWGRGEGREAYDAVLIRALGPLPVLLEYAAPLLRAAGVLIAWKTDSEEPLQASAAAAILGLEPDRVLPVKPYPARRGRCLYVYRRARPVPDVFPRRPGMARKRPLGA